eukprot:symbB.v1.2.017637.t2/scaffold1373.1/size231899/2
MGAVRLNLSVPASCRESLDTAAEISSFLGVYPRGFSSIALAELQREHCCVLAHAEEHCALLFRPLEDRSFPCRGGWDCFNGTTCLTGQGVGTWCIPSVVRSSWESWEVWSRDCAAVFTFTAGSGECRRDAGAEELQGLAECHEAF